MMVVVIPAYNEERTVGKVVRQCRMPPPPFSSPLEGEERRGGGRVIVIDDGSIDRTAEVARASGATVLQHPINRGLGAALATGITGALQILNQPPLHLPLSKEEKEGVIVTLDADGQHDPAEIPRLVEPILKGEAAVVIGSRFAPHPSSPHKWGRSKEGGSTAPLMRRLANLCGNFFTWLLFGIWVSDSQSGFRAFRADAAAKLRLRTSTMEVSSEIIREIVRLKLRMVEVPITARYTPYSLAKGQGFFRGLETLWKLLVLRFFR